MNEVYILSAVRTAVGTLMGSLKNIPASQLGSIVIKESLNRANVKPEQVDEVILGNVLMAGQSQGPARQAAMGAGIPENIPAWTINQICGSGLKSVALAADMIKAGSADCIVAGGMESMSQAPHLANIRGGINLGNMTFTDSLVLDGLTDAFSKEHMGLTAERVAEKYNLSEKNKISLPLKPTRTPPPGSRKIRRRNSSGRNSSKKRRPDCFQKRRTLQTANHSRSTQ